ncbi:hypothetical protein GCM10016234_27970 [Tianweitania populi]|uniref:Methyltransferase type 11 domain-containing protein n=1 Tax=Tianweitania populi TaxID=1607949 RepID=A0A8J3DVY2_9HYPH|nr:PIG-L family deacetylase [Tianweitania populi]GHD18069.1 hypothetical protein GCM10016234_27970 [Tianweitania populi]
MRAAHVAPVSRLVGSGGLVVLAPHPDDETLGCSALLIEAGRSKRKLGLVALTDGGSSHPGSKLFPPDSLEAIRREEQRTAMRMLGCDHAEHLRLGLPDGGSGRHPERASVAASVAELCERLGATALAAPHPDDPHPDHATAAAIALEVRSMVPTLRILFYEVWTCRLEDDVACQTEGMTAFRVETEPELKARAIACHASQLGKVVTDSPSGFVLPDWFIDHHTQPLERISWLELPGSLPGPDHFARLYADDGDPWHVRSSAYERQKRESVVSLLSETRHETPFRQSLEAGCGEGHLSGALLQAGLVQTAVGFDRDPAIIQRARNFGWGEQAHFRTGSMPADMPDGSFDLVLLSEVLYFLDEGALTTLADNLTTRLEPDACIVVVSWLGSTGTPLDGRTASDFFRCALGRTFETLKVEETPDFRIELLQRRKASVADQEDAQQDR